MEYVLIFVIGLCIGSFLNVCIYRVPRAKSIVRPRSFCPQCGKAIKWFDNVPLLSFIVLLGKCRNCGKRIPFRYPLVELLTALLGILLYWHFGPAAAFPAYWAFICALTAVTFIDLEFTEVPDVISLPGILAGIVFMTVFQIDGSTSALGSFLNSLAGMFVGGLMMFLLGVIGEWAFQKEALGGGDIKLMAMIGAFLGWKLVILAFFAAPLLGSGVALYMKFKYKTEALPYAPYLSLGALVTLLWGNKIIGFLFAGF